MKKIGGGFLVVSVLFLLQAGCITLGHPSVGHLVNVVNTAASAFIPISEEEEQVIGRDMAATVAGRYGIIRDYALTRYVNLVGNTVARESKRPDLPYRFAVLDSDSINAFSCPGGYIFVTRGTLAIIESEAELASVLAHEVAHVSEKHIIKEIEKAQFLRAGERVAGDLLHADTRIFDAVTSFGTELLFKGLSRTDEYEADKLSIIYTAEAGYDPNGLFSFLEKLKYYGSQPNSEGVKLLFSTHPTIDDRLARASTTIKMKGYDDRGGVVLADRYETHIHHVSY
jgi:predicted Zn-dependent protease